VIDLALIDKVFLNDHSPLCPDNAVAAIIQPGAGHYLMQLRDPIEHIFFPGHWGLFGGAIEAGESNLQALCRELDEELRLKIDPDAVAYLTQFEVDFSFSGHGLIRRIIYRVDITPETLAGLELHEGHSMRVFGSEGILTEPRVTPYDRWAIWLNENQERLATTGESDGKRVDQRPHGE